MGGSCKPLRCVNAWAFHPDVCFLAVHACGRSDAAPVNFSGELIDKAAHGIAGMQQKPTLPLIMPFTIDNADAIRRVEDGEER